MRRSASIGRLITLVKRRTIIPWCLTRATRLLAGGHTAGVHNGVPIVTDGLVEVLGETPIEILIEDDPATGLTVEAQHEENIAIRIVVATTTVSDAGMMNVTGKGGVVDVFFIFLMSVVFHVK